MGRELIDKGRELLSQVLGDLIRAQSHGLSYLLQLVVAEPASHLLAADQLIDAGADPRLHLIAQPAAG